MERFIRSGLALFSALATLLVVSCASGPAMATPTPTSLPFPREEALPQTMSLTIVYDNNAYDPRLGTEWGFACWLQYGDTVLLFDTGGDGVLLLKNMQTLGLDPQAIDLVVLSHIHGDHTGGMEALLSTGAQPEVYVPVTFPTSYKEQLRQRVTVHEVSAPQQILPGLYSTGKMGTSIPEQGLLLRTARGLVVITGCAHPGIAEMVGRAKELLPDNIRLVLGGFHLGEASLDRVQRICETFRELGVQQVAPCHCTGEQAMRVIAEEFGDDYIPVGVGWSADLAS